MTMWGIQQLQAVWWSPQASQIDVEQLMKTLTGGNEPTSVQKAQGTAHIVGTQGSIAYRLQTAPGRLDIFVLPDQPQDEVVLFSDHLAAYETFVSKLEVIENLISVAQRLAVVVTTARQAATESEAFRLSKEKADLSLPFDNGRDLILQVNKRRRLEEFEVDLNRIVKISSEMLQQIEVGGGGGLPIVKYFHVATYTVDVNNVPVGGRQFKDTEVRDVMRRIFTEATSLTENQKVSALAEG